MKKRILLFVCLANALISNGQQWSVFPFQSTEIGFARMSLWGNKLVLCGGSAYINDTIRTNSIFVWDGQNVTPFFGSNNYSSGFKDMIDYQGKLWVGGNFSGLPNSAVYENFYLWDGEVISTLPIGHPDRIVTSILAHNGKVYLGGPLHYGGQPSNLMSY